MIPVPNGCREDPGSGVALYFVRAAPGPGNGESGWVATVCRACAVCWHLPAVSSSGLRPRASADSPKLGRVCLVRVSLRRASIRHVGDAVRDVRVGLSQQVGAVRPADLWVSRSLALARGW
jgi:hypothetical protein